MPLAVAWVVKTNSNAREGGEERYFIGHDEWANERGNGPLGRGGVLEKKKRRQSIRLFVVDIQLDPPVDELTAAY